MAVTGTFKDLTKKEKDVLKKHLDPVGGPKSLKDKVIDAGKKVLEIGKKAVEFTPPGQVKKLVELVKDNSKRAERKLNNERLNPGKIPKPMKTGGRAGYKMGGKCKLATKGKGRAYGKNS